MQFKLICLALTAGLVALPASAQIDPCRSEQRANTGAGAVIGGILGGVLGSNVSARGHRSDGTAVGAALGALVGGAAGHGSRNCPVYGPPSYPRSAYPPDGPYDRRDEPGRFGPGGYDRYGTRDYPQVEPGLSRDSMPDRDFRYGRVDDPDDDAYNASSNDEVRECRPVRQRTQLPDGTEITRRVEACRSARYGEWTLDD